MKVGFTGTQGGMTAEQKLAFARLLRDLAPSEFHHGDCIGADAQAHQIAELLQVPAIHIWPPLANVKRAFMKAPQLTLHAAAGYLERNWSIVKACNVLVATPRMQGQEQRRSGTWATIREARRRCKPIFIVWPDGALAHEQSEVTPPAAPSPKVAPGPVIFKIRKVLTPIHGELLGYRVLVAVPNMDGHEAFSSLPAPSFAKKYLIYESSDFGETEVTEQLKRILTHLIKAGYQQIEYYEEYAARMRRKEDYDLNPTQHKERLTDEQRAVVEWDWMRGDEWFYNLPYVW